MIVGASLAALPISWLTRRIGRRFALAAGFLIAALGAGAAGMAAHAQSAVGFFSGVLIMGFATSSALATRFAAVDGEVEKGRIARVMGFVFWASALGSLIGPNLVDVLYHRGDSGRGPYWAISGFYVLCAGLSLMFSGARADRTGTSALTFRANVTSVFESGRYVPVLATSIVCHATMIGFMSMAPVYLEHRGVSRAALGVVMSVHLACMYVFSPAVSFLLPKLGERRVFLLSLSILCVSCLVFALGSTNTVVFGVALALVGAAWSIGFIASSASVASEGDSQVRLSAQGVNDVAINAGAAVSSVASSVILSRLGYGQLGWVMLFVVGLSAMFVLRSSQPARSRDL
jgi:predicted MFS family arabinose efflux permease